MVEAYAEGKCILNVQEIKIRRRKKGRKGMKNKMEEEEENEGVHSPL